MNFNNLPVARMLWAALVGLVLALLLLGWALLHQLGQIQIGVEQQVQASEARTALALRWQGLDALDLERALASALVSDGAAHAQLQQRLAQGRAGTAALQKKLAETAAFPESRPQLERLASEQAAVLALAGQAQQARLDGGVALAGTVVQEKLRPALAAYSASQDAFVALQERQRAQARAAGHGRMATAVQVAAALACLLVLAAAGLATWLLRSIHQPLRHAMGLANAIASAGAGADQPAAPHGGRRPVPGQVLQSFSDMAARLRSVVGEMRLGVQSVGGVAAQLARDQQSLSVQHRQAATELEQAAAGMAQLGTALVQSADSARAAGALVQSAAQATGHGTEVVAQVASSMKGIGARSRQMGPAIAALESLAFQTQILALNAAVEAVRAGEQGEGFEVVAGEARLLARRSTEAARELRMLFGAAVHSVDMGAQQVAQAGQGMERIAASVQHLEDLVADVATASGAQHAGAAHTGQALARLDQQVRQGALLLEQSGAAASALHGQAQHLSQVVSLFNVDTGAWQDAGQAGHTASTAWDRLQQQLPDRTPALSGAAAEEFDDTDLSFSHTGPHRTANGKGPRSRPVLASQEDWESF